jgi:hypothetical protein
MADSAISRSKEHCKFRNRSPIAHCPLPIADPHYPLPIAPLPIRHCRFDIADPTLAIQPLPMPHCPWPIATLPMNRAAT